jgi:hypothetical protein
MEKPASTSVFVAKIALAAGLLMALAGVAGSQLAPKMPLSEVLLYSGALVLCLFALLVVAAVISLTVYQAVLRMGGTDPQWFWFRSEPPGLVALRAQAKDSAANDAQPHGTPISR